MTSTVDDPPVEHVVFCVDSDGFAGAEESLRILISHLPAQVAVTVVGPHRPILERLAADRTGAAIVVVPPLTERSDLRHAPVVWWRLRRLRPTAVHLNKTEVANLRYVELLLALQRRRVVSVVHHVEPPTSTAARLISRLLARRASAVVAVGTRLALDLERILGLARGGVAVIPNALPELAPPAAPQRGTRPLTVGVLARLVPHKAVDDVIAAVAPHGSLRLLIGGEGPERVKLERQVEQLGMADRVRFLGWVEPDEVLDHCDLLVSAARIEGHPMALLDARRRGIPIVAADVGGVSAIVADGKTGILVAPADVAGLSAAIGRLADNEVLRTSMGSMAADRARKSFSPEAMASSYCRLYAGARTGADAASSVRTAAR